MQIERIFDSEDCGVRQGRLRPEDQRVGTVLNRIQPTLSKVQLAITHSIRKTRLAYQHSNRNNISQFESESASRAS